MSKLVIVKNPFQPYRGREIHTIPKGFTVKQAAKLAGFDNMEINCVVNDKLVSAEDYVLPDDSIVTLSPVVAKAGGGKQVVMLVAAVALSLAAIGVGGFVAANASAAGTAAASAHGAAALAAATGSAAFAGYAAAAAVMFVGNYLIGRFAGTTGSTAKSSNSDPTYSWSGVSTLEGQDNPITLTYGKVKSGGQTIGKYITTKDNKEYLNWLVSAGEGELTISNIKLNDNDYTNYEGVTVETRTGTNNQDVISNFNDTYFTKSLSYQLLDEQDYVDTCQGNSTEGIIVKIEFSNGLYKVNDEGKMKTAWVEFEGFYRLSGTETWTQFIGNQTVITKSFAYATFAVDTSTVASGDYDVECSENNIVLKYPNGNKITADIAHGESGVVGPFKLTNVCEYVYGDVDAYETKTGVIIVGDVAGKVSAKQSSAVRKEYRIDNIPAGAYEVKIRVKDRSNSIDSTKASVRCWWTALTSIVYDDFIYPNIALIGIKALATDQISGSPSLTFIKERKKVYVYNPNSETYVMKDANNPAWAAYDMLHQAARLWDINKNRYVYDVRGVPAKHIIWEQFNEWANFCLKKKLYVNIEVTQADEMLECINSNVANCGRGVVVRFGTRYGCVFDCAKQPVQMFGMGNIIAGSFSEEFLQTSDRANCVEITYTDADQDYNRNTITIYSDTYDNDAEEKTAQATYNGITSYSQAYREGVYQLYCNKYQLRTVTFSANIDAIACTIGDVILVAHDVPRWANSGRIYKVDADNRQLILPVELDTIEGNYRIAYRTVKDIIHESSINILENGNGYCTVYVQDGFDSSDMPQVNDIFDIALTNIGTKPFIVKALSRAQDFTRTLTCVEYNENLYSENYDIPPVQYSRSVDDKAKNVTNVSAKQVTYVTPDGNRASTLFVSWQAPNNSNASVVENNVTVSKPIYESNVSGLSNRYTVLVSTDKQNWNLLKSGINDTNLETDVAYGEEYYLKIITVLGISQSTGVTYGPIKIGADELPPDVTAIDTEVLRDGTRRYSWDFNYPTPNDIAGFKLKYLQGNTPNWDKGYAVQEGLITAQPYETTTIRQGAHVVMIKAVDFAGQESENYAYCFVDFGDPIEENILYTKDFSSNSWRGVTTNGRIAADGFIHAQQSSSYWESQSASFWESSTEHHWEQMYNEFYAAASTTALAGGYFWLKYNITGNYDLTYRIRNHSTKFKPYSTRVLVEAGDIIDVKFTSAAGATDTVLKSLTAIIDVPDSTEHFSSFTISRNGTELPIKTPNYFTTGVNIDNIQTDVVGTYELQIVSKQPCIIKFNKINKDARNTKTGVDVIADVTWQGFSKEVTT